MVKNLTYQFYFHNYFDLLKKGIDWIGVLSTKIGLSKES